MIMDDIDKNYARTFMTPSGHAVLAHLRKITIERKIGINATNEELRWAAAQCALVHQIENLVSKGVKNE